MTARKTMKPAPGPAFEDPAEATVIRRIRTLIEGVDLDCECRERLDGALARFTTLEHRRMLRRHLTQVRQDRDLPVDPRHRDPAAREAERPAAVDGEDGVVPADADARDAGLGQLRNLFDDQRPRQPLVDDDLGVPLGHGRVQATRFVLRFT